MESNEEKLTQLERENASLQRQLDAAMRENDHLALEKNFIESSVQHLNFLRNAQDGVYFTNSRDEVIFVNPYLMSILGYDQPAEQGVLGHPLPNVIWDNLADSEEISAKVKAEGFIRERQVVMRNIATRERVYVSISGTRVRDDDGHLVGTQYLLCNITGKMQVIEELHQRNHELAALNLIAEAAIHPLEIEDVLNNTAMAVLTVLGTPAIGWIHLYGDDTQLRQRVERRFIFDQPSVEAAALRYELADRVATERQPLLLMAGDNRLARLGGQALISVPLCVGDLIIGALSVLAVTRRSYSDEDVKLLTLLSPRIGAAINNACLYSNLAAQLGQLRQHDRL